MKPTTAKVRSVTRRCEFCGAHFTAPPRFTTLVECGPRKLHATAVPGGLPRYTTRDGHALVVAPPSMRKPGAPRTFRRRVAAAVSSALAVFKGTT